MKVADHGRDAHEEKGRGQDGEREVVVDGEVLAGAAGGFLVWNWHPAKVFLGDVGSLPIGLLLFWLTVVLAVMVWYMFLVGHIVNNVRGFGS